MGCASSVAQPSNSSSSFTSVVDPEKHQDHAVVELDVALGHQKQKKKKKNLRNEDVSAAALELDPMPRYGRKSSVASHTCATEEKTDKTTPKQKRRVRKSSFLLSLGDNVMNIKRSSMEMLHSRKEDSSHDTALDEYHEMPQSYPVGPLGRLRNRQRREAQHTAQKLYQSLTFPKGTCGSDEPNEGPPQAADNTASYTSESTADPTGPKAPPRRRFPNIESSFLEDSSSRVMSFDQFPSASVRSPRDLLRHSSSMVNVEAEEQSTASDDDVWGPCRLPSPTSTQAPTPGMHPQIYSPADLIRTL